MNNQVIIFVGKSKKWINNFVKEMKKLKVNSGIEPDTDIGPFCTSYVSFIYEFN